MKRLSIFLITLVCSLTFSYLFFYSKSLNENRTSDTYKIKAVKIPAFLEFAGERVPSEKIDVNERLDREFLVNTYWQSNGLLLIKRSHKYFPTIEPILEKYGIPDDFKYLAVIESGLQNITSPAGAKGFWQLMKGTARDCGLEVNSNVDERYSLEKSTEAACQYLLKQKERFGTWTLAAAAYNVGPNGLSRRMQAQDTEDYYDLLLPIETSRYLPRLIAIKSILESPKSYGFVFEKQDLYNLPKFNIVEVDTVVSDLTQFSKAMDMTYRELKLYNPWLRENKLNNATRRLYKIKIPVDTTP